MSEALLIGLNLNRIMTRSIIGFYMKVPSTSQDDEKRPNSLDVEHAAIIIEHCDMTTSSAS